MRRNPNDNADAQLVGAMRDAGLDELPQDLRDALQASAFPRLADALCERVCEALRGMPGAEPEQIRRAELLVALQLIDGTRSTA